MPKFIKSIEKSNSNEVSQLDSAIWETTLLFQLRMRIREPPNFLRNNWNMINQVYWKVKLFSSNIWTTTCKNKGWLSQSKLVILWCTQMIKIWWLKQSRSISIKFISLTEVLNKLEKYRLSLRACCILHPNFSLRNPGISKRALSSPIGVRASSRFRVQARWGLKTSPFKEASVSSHLSVYLACKQQGAHHISYHCRSCRQECSQTNNLHPYRKAHLNCHSKRNHTKISFTKWQITSTPKHWSCLKCPNFNLRWWLKTTALIGLK